MTIWRPNLTRLQGPAYKRVADAIGTAIADGTLREGDRLPTQRDLAHALGLSLNTISRAYADAVARGFLEGVVGRGTFVRGSGAIPPQAGPASLERTDAGPVDFSLNLPAPGAGAAVLAETLAELAHRGGLPAFLDYQTTRDFDRHAEAAADWLARVGLPALPADVVVTCGAQHGLLVALLATLRPGAVLLTDALSYAPIKALARHLGLKLMPVEAGLGGLEPPALDAACRRVSAGALYCLPTLHTPTTVTWSTDRRAEIAAVARRHDLTVIEDDVFGFLPPERPPPLAVFAPERTLYVTSVSKSLAPGLRVGFLWAPTALRSAVRSAVNLSCWMPPPLMTEIACRWIANGTADSLNAVQRTEAAARQVLAREILAATPLVADPYGFHAWLPLPPSWRSEAFRRAAETRGVKVLTADVFAVRADAAPDAVRLCLSHEAERVRVAEGLRTIAALLAAPDAADGLVV